MTVVRALRWTEGVGGMDDRHDGCSTRRRALLEVIERSGRLECCTLHGRGGVVSTAAAALRVFHFLRSSTSFDRLLLFYPDLPLFHPPRRMKVPLLRLLVAACRRACRAAGAKLHVDVVDLPRWQAIDLGYPLRMAPAALRRAERYLLQAADMVTVPAPAFADLLASDLGVDPTRVVVVPNGLPRTPEGPPPEPTLGAPAFLYAGSLARSLRRGVERLVDGFLARAARGAVLHLCGADGEWLTGRALPESVRLHGHLAEAACLDLAEHCHFGLVPYPEEPYFRWCCPSKLGLYLAAGVAVLSSRLDETTRLVGDLGVGEARPLDDFPSFFEDGAALLERYPRALVRERCRAFDWSRRATAALCPIDP